MVKYKIGNGLNTFLWHDPWLPFGSIYDKYGQRVIFDTAIPTTSKVQTIIDGDAWSWPITSSWALMELKMASTLIHAPSNTNDVVLWTPSPNGSYTSSHTWAFLRETTSKVPWAHLVWFPGRIPRQSFITWLAIRNKLATQDRIWTFTQGPLACVLCNKNMDSHDHLFFTCVFSSYVWQVIMSRFDMTGCPLDWHTILRWAASKWKSKKPHHIMPRMCLGTMVYAIWRERNARIFKQESKSKDKLIRDIVSSIHDQMKIKWHKDPKLHDYLSLWS